MRGLHQPDDRLRGGWAQDLLRLGAGRCRAVFFRGRPGAPFAVICPGGGFSYVGSIHEGFPHALALSRMGYNAFVVPSGQCTDGVRGLGGGHRIHLPPRFGVAGRYGRLFRVGQFGRRTHGGVHGQLRAGGVRRIGTVATVHRCHGLHGAQRVHPARPAYLFGGGEQRRHSQSEHDAPPHGSSASHRYPGRVSPVSELATRLRTGHRDKCRGVD